MSAQAVPVGPVTRPPIATPVGPIPIGTGGASSITPYIHTQDEPADTWVVEHGLGRHPVAWQLYDATGRERSQYRVEHLSLTRLRVLMDSPTAGTFETF